MSVRIQGFVFPAGAPIQPTESLDILNSRNGEKRFVWLDLAGELDAKCEGQLMSLLEWHPTVIQNIKLPSAHPRLTPFEEYTHVTIHVLPSDAALSGDLRVRELDLVLGDGYLLTFHHDAIPMVDQLLAELPSMRPAPRSPDLILHRFLVSSQEAIAPEMERVDDVIIGLEEEALYRPGQDLLERIVHARNGLYALHRSMTPQLQVVHDLNSGACRFVTPYAQPFFRSLENRLRGQIEDIIIHKDVAQNALELYRSAITQKTNEIIRLLTVVSTPLLVLSFLTGLYGMNVPLPFSTHPHVFTWMLGFGVALFFGMLWWFRRREWF